MSEEQMAKLQKQVDQIIAEQQRETIKRKIVLGSLLVAVGTVGIIGGIYAIVKSK